MGYYDYSHYFQTIINNQNTLILHLDVFLFMFIVYFLYKFISSMIRGRF